MFSVVINIGKLIIHSPQGGEGKGSFSFLLWKMRNVQATVFLVKNFLGRNLHVVIPLFTANSQILSIFSSIYQNY